MRPQRRVIWFLSLLIFATASAKEPPAQVMLWPASGTPVVRFTFGKFKETSSTAKQHNYMTDVTAQNVWDKKISAAQVTVYAFDKAKVRIADRWISISDVEPRGTVKFQVFFNASGTINSLELVPKTLQGLGGTT